MNRKHHILVSIMLALAVAGGAAFTMGLDSKVFAFSTYSTPSPYNGVGYSAYKHNADKFSGTKIIHGVDVSEYQSSSKSNWGTAKNNAVQFSIMRISWTGYGSSGTKHYDSDFTTHYTKTRDAGIMQGVYVFSQAISDAEAKAEAEFAVNRLQQLGIGPEDLELPIYMDYEFAGKNDGGRMYGNLTKARATSYARTFCKTVESYGYEAGLYACTSFLNDYIDSSFGNEYDVWCAQYYKTCEYTGVYTKWQYSSAAQIGGILTSSGGLSSVDVNFWYLDTNRSPNWSNDIAGCEIGFEDGQTAFAYTGKALKPTVVVSKGGTTLTEGRDYTVWYLDNVNKGKGYAYVKGINKYKGYKLVEFTIRNANIGISTIKVGNEDGIKLSTAAVSAGYSMNQKDLYGIISGTKASAVKQALELHPQLSDYTIKMLSSGGSAMKDSDSVKSGCLVGIYNTKGDLVASLNIVADGKASATPIEENLYYDGKYKTTGFRASFGSMSSEASAEQSSELFSIEYPSESTMPGSYTAKLKGKGLFEGASVSASYNIIIKPTELDKVVSEISGFTVYWKMQASSYVSGYQLQYSTNEAFSDGLKSDITGYKTLSKSVQNKKCNMTYYVRVRSYKVIGTVKYYSDWSNVKSVKTQ